MFFIASKILSFLIDPFLWIVIFIILALVARKKYRRNKYLWTGFVLFIFFSNTFIYNSINKLWNLNDKDLVENYEYGILLGGMISPNSSEYKIKFNSSAERLLSTIELYHSKRIKKIIISGASGSMVSDLVEADYLKRYLINIGIPEKDIFTERKSKNTYENAKYTTQLINEMHISKIPNCLLITSDYHMRRSLSCFNKTGLKADPYVYYLEPKYVDFETLIIPQSNILIEWKKLIHEIFGYLTYSIAGYI